jgi:hypothetical protein
MVIDENLPLGIIANTAAVMGVTIGKHLPQAVGVDVVDKTGHEHLGVIEFPIPILKGSKDKIRELRSRLYEESSHDLIVVDFSDTAQSCKTYGEYIQKMADVPEADLYYFGIAICGDGKKVNKLTGDMPLLR